MSRVVHATLLLALTSLLASPLRAMPSVPIAPKPLAGEKVFLYGCAVQFATKSGATSSTRPGMFTTDQQKRDRNSVSLVYDLAGVDSTVFQRLTDEICAGAPAALKAAGFDLVTEGVTDHWLWKQSVEKGKNSPDERGMGNVKGVAYAPSGQKLIVAEAIGGVSGGQNQISAETTIGVDLGARPVSLLYMVDFATVEAERKGRMRDQDVAEVKATLRVSVGLIAVSYDPTQSRCFKGAFGESRNRQQCMLKKFDTRMDNLYVSSDTDEKQFTDPIVSVERTSLGGAGVALAAANVLGVLGGTGTASYRLYTVTVDPAKYEAAVREGAASLLAPAMKWIYEPESRPKKGRR